MLCCFNGAADLHPRKHPQTASVPGIPDAASMGPRTSIPENVELVLRSDASMGPRTYIRGNFFRRRTWGHHKAASMGPRTYIRGNFVRLANNLAVGFASMGR